MLVEGFLQTRTDRFIAAARAVIALLLLAGIWIDRSQPATAEGFTYGLLVSYLTIAGAVLVASRRENTWSAEIALGSHVVDLAVFSTLMFLTAGATSPFFLLFTFSLLSATFRWRWKGALWTAVAVLVLLVAIAAFSRALAPALPFAIEQFMIRCAHVVVIGAMLVYFGFRQERSAGEAARLAAWQPDPVVGTDVRALLEACLAHVANVFGAPRVVLVLQGGEEPWASVSVWEHGIFHQDRPDEGTLDKTVPEALAEAVFMRRPNGDMLVADGHGRPSLWQGEPPGSTVPGYWHEQVLSVPIRSQYATGRLFIADKQDFVREEMTLASLVAVQIEGLLDRLHVIESAQAAASTEERLRLARDLHDGILQTLSGTALQLEAIRRLAEHDPDAVSEKIRAMQAWLLDEQREMRRFIGKLRPAGQWVRSGLAHEAADLASLVRALEQQWGAAISLSPGTAGPALTPEVTPEMEFHVRQILREAVANAVRHGGATEIRLEMATDEDDLRLEVRDNGKGLPQHGHFDARQCAEERIGPRSLRERIVGLGGSLDIDSTAAGVTLSIELPMRSMPVRSVDGPASDRSDRR